jgi:hypothetical protein
MLGGLGKTLGMIRNPGARKAALGNPSRGDETRPLDLTPT